MPIIQRKEIRSLQPGELLALRRAMILFQQKAINDPHSYICIARHHGIPERNCDHTSAGFLAWHRMYILLFENELRKIDNTVSLPYWDWTDERYFNDCPATAHNEQTFTDNGVKPNPLFAGPIEDGSRLTERSLAFNTNRLKAHAKTVKAAIGKSREFTDLNTRLKAAHDGIHANVGGDMFTMARAAFDPIFWSHHATVDRQWAIWQKLNAGGITIPDTILETELKGFAGKKVKDVLDFENELGYKYTDLETDIEEYKVTNKYMDDLVILEVSDVAIGTESYIVDVFLCKKGSDEQKRFASSFGIFGTGNMNHGHMGHMNHHARSNYFLDITETLKELNAGKQDVSIQLQALDGSGNVVNEKELGIGGIRIL